MNHYRKQLDFIAPAQTVFAAITTQKGIEGWWTQACTVNEGVGASVTVRFGKTYKIMRIETFAPSHELRWRCVESYLFVPGLIDRKDEWKDHEIIFRLNEHPPGRTTLDFQHIGLNPSVECYEVCTGGWEQFLASLKLYAETGKGRPFQA